MKKGMIICIFVVMSLLFFNMALSGNPFSSKINGQGKVIQKKRLVPRYLGYSFLKNRRFAIIELGGRQYTPEAGETIKGYQFLKIEPCCLWYKTEGKTLRVLLED